MVVEAAAQLAVLTRGIIWGRRPARLPQVVNMRLGELLVHCREIRLVQVCPERGRPPTTRSRCQQLGAHGSIILSERGIREGRILVRFFFLAILLGS
jgi:hypothetical protein